MKMEKEKHQKSMFDDTFFAWHFHRIVVHMKLMNDRIQRNVQQSIIIVHSFLQVSIIIIIIIIIFDGIKIERLAHVNTPKILRKSSWNFVYSKIFENVNWIKIWKMIGKTLKMFVELNIRNFVLIRFNLDAELYSWNGNKNETSFIYVTTKR
jgi:hypothetical protein